MARKSKEYIEQEVPTEQDEPISFPVVENVTTDTVSPVQTKSDTTVKEQVIDASKMTDAELMQYMQSRREELSKTYAIKSVNVPMHLLINASSVMPKMTDTEVALQGRINHLQNRLNVLEKK